MNLKKIVCSFFCLTVMCSAIPSISFAATQWSFCNVEKVGTSWSNYRVQLKNCDIDPANGTLNGWTNLFSSTKQDMLALAVLAHAGNRKVSVGFDWNIKSSGYVIIHSMLLVD